MLDGEPPQIDPSAWICPVMEQAIELGAAELSSYAGPILVHANWENELHVSTLVHCDFWQGSEQRFAYAYRADAEDGFQPQLYFFAASDPDGWGEEQVELQSLAVGFGHHAAIMTAEFEWSAETWSFSRCEWRSIEPRAEARPCQDE